MMMMRKFVEHVLNGPQMRCQSHSNRRVLRCRVNARGESVAVRRAAGRLFQMCVPATAKLFIPSYCSVVFLAQCYNNKLTKHNCEHWWWDSAICDLFDAIKVQYATFPLPRSQDTAMWVVFGMQVAYFVVLISAFCCTMWSQSTIVTDRQTDRHHAHSISTTF